MSLFSHLLCLYFHIFCVFVLTSSVSLFPHLLCFGFVVHACVCGKKACKVTTFFSFPQIKTTFFVQSPIFFQVRRHLACGQKPLRAKKSNFSSLCSRSISLRYVRGASAPCFVYQFSTGYAGILPAVKSLFAQKKVIPLRYVRGAFLFVMFAELSSSLCSRSFSSVFCVSIFHRVRRHPACGQKPLRAKKK